MIERKPIVERSQIAKSNGGPVAIRALPLLDRLYIGAQIADELGRELPYYMMKTRHYDKLWELAGRENRKLMTEHEQEMVLNLRDIDRNRDPVKFLVDRILWGN